jgi:hypothetical protein
MRTGDVQFILPWNTRFAVRYFAPMLSHYSLALRGQGMYNSFKTTWIDISFAVASVMTLYFVSVLDWETVFCFLAHHEIKLGPRKIAKLPVDFLSSVHPAQSVSGKALTIVEDERRMTNANEMVCLRKWRIRLTAVQWTDVGAWRYWQTLLTKKEISGQVSVKYCKASTILQYIVASSGLRGTPSCAAILVSEDRGVGAGLQLIIPARSNRSVVYFCWPRNRLLADRVT